MSFTTLVWRGGGQAGDVTWILADWLFHLPQDLTNMAIMLAALPTGTGAFMLAEHYRRDV